MKEMKVSSKMWEKPINKLFTKKETECLKYNLEKAKENYLAMAKACEDVISKCENKGTMTTAEAWAVGTTLLETRPQGKYDYSDVAMKTYAKFGIDAFEEFFQFG